MGFISTEGGTIRLYQRIYDSAQQAIKILLEERFLYQNVKISDYFDKDLLNNPIADRYVEEFRKMPNVIGMDCQNNGVMHSFRVKVPSTINTRCEFCKETTPHNPNFSYSVGGAECGADFDETIIISAQCQKCKEGSLSFLVRRKGLRLQLVGRSQVDAFVFPYKMSYYKDAKRLIGFFSEAMMAEKTGSSLAAVCLLRVALEQFMRAALPDGGIKLDGQNLYDEFAKHLHRTFPRDCVASLSEVYGNLSKRMHNPSLLHEGDFDENFKKVLSYMSFLELMPLERVGENE